jgi:hypothetical protein
MNPRAFDLITRSVTTALLALGLIIGVYFGAHVSQNGSGTRARSDQLLTAEVKGEPPPKDPLARLEPK